MDTGLECCVNFPDSVRCEEKNALDSISCRQSVFESGPRTYTIVFQSSEEHLSLLVIVHSHVLSRPHLPDTIAFLSMSSSVRVLKKMLGGTSVPKSRLKAPSVMNRLDSLGFVKQENTTPLVRQLKILLQVCLNVLRHMTNVTTSDWEQRTLCMSRYTLSGARLTNTRLTM